MFNIGKMKDKQEIIGSIIAESEITDVLAAIGLAKTVWNAAIDMAAESATTKTKLYDYGDWETETIVDTKSILNLKFDKDENK